MSTVIIIPARYASTRYPGKPLVTLTDSKGIGKTLIQRSYEKACLARKADAVYIATDDDRIANHAKDFGAQVLMTSIDCRNGTERVAHAISQLSDPYDIVVNFQGDAPMTPPWFVDDLIDAIQNDPDADVATPVLPCDRETYLHFVRDRAEGRVGGTTAVFGRNNRALYFSKEVVPYIDPQEAHSSFNDVFHHVGLYAYRPEALKTYARLQPGILEKREGLEQLRFLENEHTLLCVPVDSRGHHFWELNNPVDVKRIEEYL